MCVILFGIGAKGLSLSTDYKHYFKEKNQQLIDYEYIQKTFTKGDNVLFVVSSRSGDIYNKSSLQSIEALTSKAWKLPYTIRVESITNFQNSYGDEDNLIVEKLVKNSDTLNASDIQKIKDISLSDPLIKKRLVSYDGSTAAVNAVVEWPSQQPKDGVIKVVTTARQLAAEIMEENPDIVIELTGQVLINNAFPEAAQVDGKTLMPIMFLVILFVLAFMLRDVASIFATLLVIIFSIVVAMGSAGWFKTILTPPATSAPNIILTIAVANAVHILVSFINILRSENKSKNESIKESIRVNIQPILLTNLTTVFGFLTLNFSDSPPFNTLGNITAVGVLAAMVLSLTFLPALISTLPIRKKGNPTRGSATMRKFADWVINKRTAILIGFGVTTICVAVLIPRNEVNDIFVHYFDESMPIRTATDHATEKLTGPLNISYAVSAQRSGGIYDPLYLKKLDQFATWLKEQPEVNHVSTITDVFKRLNLNMHNNAQEWYRLPEDTSQAAQYMLLYEMSLPLGFDLNNQKNVDNSSTRLVVSLKIVSTNTLIAFEQKVKNWVHNSAPEWKVQGSSPALMFAHIGKNNIWSMLEGTTIALILISLTLIIALGSFKYGMLSMVPNLLPAAMAFGVWGLFVGQIGLASSIITAMTLGIVVDDTVHFLSKYLRAKREKNLSPEECIRYAFEHVGTALWVTSAVLFAGFMVLALSPFKLNNQMGLLTAITIAFALFVDFTLLPSLLSIKKGKKSDEKDTSDLSDTAIA